MDMKPFSIMSPDSGLVTDQPNLLLEDASTSDMQDMFFKYGEVRRYNKRMKAFDDDLGNAVLNQYRFAQDALDTTFFMYFTKTDILYRDTANSEFVFLNKIYAQGTVTTATTLTGSQFRLDFSMPSGESLLANVKAGDFIRLSSGSTDLYASDTWYEVDSVTDADTLVCDGVLPSGYDPADVTGGDTYVVRTTFQGLDTDYWSVDTFNETLIATNNAVDYPIKWDGSGQIEDMTTEFKCKWLSSFGGRVVALNLVAGGTSYPINYRWSGLDDLTDWGGTGSDAGEAQLYDGTGYITRAFRFRDYLYIVKSESISRIWAVTTDDIFNSKLVRTDLGTKAPHSFIFYRDVVYFYCTQDKTFRKFDGYYDEIMSGGVRKITQSIYTASEKIIQGYFVTNERQLCWSIPYSGSATLNKLMIADVDFRKNPWSLIDMVAVSFGEYVLANDYDWSTLPFDEWASWNWESWRSSEDVAETKYDFCTDYDGYVHQMNASRQDDGEDFTSYIVFNTDMTKKKSSLALYKRLLLLQLYLRDEGTGTVDISIRTDNNIEWEEVGSVNLNGGKTINIAELPVDVRGKTFEIKLSSEYYFEFIGMILWAIPLGDR